MNAAVKRLVNIVLLFCVLPCILVAENHELILPNPWSLKAGWWKQLSGDSDENIGRNIDGFVQSLQQIEQQVPPENQEDVRIAVERISLNTSRFLALRATKGWKIEAAPTILDVYTIAELLTAAKDVKSSESKLQETSDELIRLTATRDRTVRQIDEFYIRYDGTAENSLQRTLAGLNLMVSVTNRVMIEERMRLIQEQLSGIEQKLIWAKSILATASTRLAPASLDLDKIEAQIVDITKRKETLDHEILQLETELASGKSTNQFDVQPLLVVGKRVLLARAQVEIHAAQAKKGIAILIEQDLPTASTIALLEESKNWTDDLDRVEKRLTEWRGLLRREQDAAENSFLRDEESNGDTNGAKYQSLVGLQRTVQQTLVNIRHLDIELFQGRQLVKLVNDEAIKELDWFSGFWRRVYFNLQNLIANGITFLSYTLFRINERPVSTLKIFSAFGVFFFAYGFSFFFRRLLSNVASRNRHIAAASVYTFKRVAHYTILLIGFIWALSSLGIDFSNLLIIAGALSVGIGFGLQGIVNNFLGGLIVLFDRKLRIGDFIELSGGEMGHITEVNVQNTVIRTLTGHDILVPNSDIITRQLTNWTLRDQYARFHLPFGVAYGSDKDKVRDVVQKAATAVPETVSGHKTIADPSVWLVGFGESSLDFELVVWVDFRQSRKRQSSLRASYFWEIETALKENGLEIPFPQRDLHLKSGDWSSKEGKAKK
jgi:potassium efflux system protein